MARFSLSHKVSMAAIPLAVLSISLPSSVQAQPTINPAFVDNNDVVGSQNPSGTPEESVGFQFESKNSSILVNALGVSAQTNVPWTIPYTVTLFQFDTSGISILAQETFNPGDPNLIPRDDNGDGFIDNYWLPLSSPVPLPISDSTVDPSGDFGYAIAQSGDFNDPAGNFIEQQGTITFNPNIAYLGNGFNVDTDVEYPFPSFIAYNIIGDPSSGEVFGYWNPNLSLVPGPLPLLGAAAGFGWSRRLRKRIRASK